jgi:hypothetical protein
MKRVALAMVVLVGAQVQTTLAKPSDPTVQTE